MKMTILVLAAAGLLVAQSEKGEKGRAGDAGNSTTMTGCLTKGADQPQHYNFVDQASGKQWTVTGLADLEKHSANHTVKLTGSPTAKVFNVTKVEHVSATCQASAPAK